MTHREDNGIVRRVCREKCWYIRVMDSVICFGVRAHRAGAAMIIVVLLVPVVYGLDAKLTTCPHIGYFGKVGMRHFHLTRNQYWKPVLNLDKLWTLVPEEQRKGLTASSTEVPVIDTLAAGYGKVLGKGRLPQLPFIVKARFVSELAEKKIKAAGGAVKLVA